MDIITITSDFGQNSIYVASSKAYLYANFPGICIIDITHGVEPCDITEAAYIMRTIKNDFPAGTVHLLAVDAKKRTSNANIVVLELENQYFISYDSGLLTMIANNFPAKYASNFTHTGRHFTSVQQGFGETIKILMKDGFNALKPMPLDKLAQKVMQKPVITEEVLSGNILYFDERGLAYTNIQRKDFDKFTQGKSMQIRLTKFENISKISEHLADLDPGSPGAFFNSIDFLCIGIYHDDTRLMLGFKKGHTIMIEKI